MLLFLDIDGVLHPHDGYREDLLLTKLPMLEDVLRVCPDVDVVISSTWRRTRTLQELKDLFSTDIAPRIIGKTMDWQNFQDDFVYGAYVRQAEIEQWLRDAGRPWEAWLALDDQGSMFRPFCKNLFLTDSSVGLTSSDCDLLVQRLSQPSR